MSERTYDAARGTAYLHGSTTLMENGQMGLALYYTHEAERCFRRVHDGPSMGAASRQENRVIGCLAAHFAEAAGEGGPGFLAALTASREMGDYRERTDGISAPFEPYFLRAVHKLEERLRIAPDHEDPLRYLEGVKGRLWLWNEYEGNPHVDTMKLRRAVSALHGVDIDGHGSRQIDTIEVIVDRLEHFRGRMRASRVVVSSAGSYYEIFRPKYTSPVPNPLAAEEALAAYHAWLDEARQFGSRFRSQGSESPLTLFFARFRGRAFADLVDASAPAKEQDHIVLAVPAKTAPSIEDVLEDLAVPLHLSDRGAIWYKALKPALAKLKA